MIVFQKNDVYLHQTLKNMGQYIVSARKYRPMTFDSVVGQEALTTTLKNSVKSGKLAHAYLFCGPRGVGKTTCARIFAKVINCSNLSPDGEACGECESCKAFNEQRSMNIFELDAASNNSVEDIRQLTEQTRIPPQVGKYKVFIIDEVHMLSAAAFNAFLKTLEEPPSYVIFILATTEKHKILPTILSRCQIYDFERMTVQNTVNHLKMVAQKEGVQYEDSALELIAEKADGGMRDALSIFDQANSYCQGNITYQKVLEDLNVLDSEYYFQMADLAVENKVSELMVLTDQILSKGFEGSQMTQGFAKHLRNVMMAKDEATIKLLETSLQTAEKYKQQAQKCPTKFLYGALRLLNECDQQYRMSANKRLLVEITLIEVAQLTQEDDNPAAGRRPISRLKSLFKHLQISPLSNKTAANRVAAEGSSNNAGNTATRHGASASQTDTSASQTGASTNSNVTSGASQTSSSSGNGLSGSIVSGTSGNSAQGSSGNGSSDAGGAAKRMPAKGFRLASTYDRARQATQAATQVEEQEQKEENETFDPHQLAMQWMSMCTRMPAKYVALASRMKNMAPHITDFPNVEVVANNENIYGNLKTVESRVQATLRLALHNSHIQFTVRLAKPEELKPRLSKAEQFAQMQKKFEPLGKLCEMMQLELR